MIEPTIGRIVWYTPTELNDRGFRLDKHQPCAAWIVYVHDDRKVNVLVATHEAVMVQCFNIQLLQDDDPIPDAKTPYVAWMPYQKGQAAKSLPPEKPRPAPAPVDTLSTGADVDGL